MSNTGVVVSEGAIEAFTNFKLKRRPKKAYLTFKLNDQRTQVVLDQEGPETATYDDFISSLCSEPDSCRYGVFIVQYESNEGNREKTGFFVWCPESSKVREKMLYAGTKDTVKKAFEGVQFEVQGNEIDDLDYANVLEKCNKQFI